MYDIHKLPEQASTGQPCTAVLDPCSGTSEGCQLVLESHIAEIGSYIVMMIYQIRD